MEPPPKGRFNAGVPIQQMSGFDPAAAAVGNLGNAVSQTADLALQLQEEQDRQDIGDAELIIQSEARKIAQDLAETVAPSEHYEKAQTRFDSAITKALKGRDLRPSFEAQLLRRLRMFADVKLEKISHDSRVMQLENGKRLHYARIKDKEDHEDFEGARSLWREGVGLYYPKETAEIGELRINRAEKIRQLEKKADEGNSEFFEQEDLGISDADRNDYKRKADYSRRRRASEEMGVIDGEVALGKIRTQEELEEALEKTQFVDEATKAKAISSWKSQVPITPDEKKSVLDRMEEAYGWYSNGEISKDEYFAIHHDISKQVYSFGKRPGTGGVRARLYSLDPAQWKNGFPDTKTMKSLTARSFVKDYARAGGMGKVPEDAQGSSADKFKAQGVIDDLEEQVLRSVDGWLNSPAGENATEPEIRDEVIKRTTAIVSGNLLDEEQGDYYRTMLPKILGDLPEEE